MIYIYKLIDPRDGKIRYVGKTNDLKVRRKTHCSRRFNTSCSVWIWKLRDVGMKPIIEALEEIPDGHPWEDREQYWIDRLRREGHELLNAALAGAGPPVPHVVSLETRDKLRQRFKRRPLPEWQKEHLSRINTGKKQSPETVAKRQATIRANRPEGWKKKTSHDFKEAARIRDGKPKKFSPEWKAKISETLRNRFAMLPPEEQERLREQGRNARRVP